MKKIHKYIIALIAAVAFCSCSQDKGNYEYVDLTEPAVSGVVDMDVLTFSQLKIVPRIDGGEFPSSEYSFQWKVLDNVAMTEPVVIGQERELDYEVRYSR